MALQFITLKNALKLMRKCDDRGFAVPFSLRWVTYDEARKTGGKIKNAEKAVLPTQEQRRAQGLEQPSRGRQPRHFANQTRNIKLMNGDLCKVHIYLITRINNMIVL